jgi:hypothetical protein
MPPAPDNYSLIKERIVEVCALDGKPFETVAGEGFIMLTKQLMNAGALIGTGFSVNDLLPHSTTVMSVFYLIHMYFSFIDFSECRSIIYSMSERKALRSHV